MGSEGDPGAAVSRKEGDLRREILPLGSAVLEANANLSAERAASSRATEAALPGAPLLRNVTPTIP